MNLRRFAVMVTAALALAAVITGPSGAASAQEAAEAHGRARPAAPTDVRVPALAYDEDSVTLVWNKPAEHESIVDYRVYRDGRLLGSADDGATATSPAKPHIDAFYADPANAGQYRVVMNNFTATGLRPDTRYRFTVRSVTAAGVESRDSRPVLAATTPVPETVDVTAHGAVGDGSTVNTAAIQAAIDATPPGGRTLVPAGVFKTGALWLHSDMTLEVAAGATLLGSENADDYPWDYKLYDYSTDTRFYSLINAHTYDYGSLHDIRIVGDGTIDGNGWKQAGHDAEGFPISAPSGSGTVGTNGILAKNQVAKAAALGSTAPYPTRSNLITMRGVTNVYYGGFTALNPSNHTLVNLHSDNVTVNGVTMFTYDVNNADGVEFAAGDGLTVINNVFDTGDDCMNFAAGLGAKAGEEPPTRNAWISNNYFREGHGAIVEGSHTGAWIENIVAEDNVLNRTDVALRMKTNPDNGGGSRNVVFRDSAVRNITNQAFIFTSEYSDANAAIVVEPAPEKARFQDVWVENVTVDGTGRESISVIGAPDRPHTRLHFEDVRFINAKPTRITHLTDSTFDDVVFDNTADPWVIANSAGLSFGGATTNTPVSADAASGPSWPAESAVTVSDRTDTSVALSWTAASDDTGIPAYRVLGPDGTVLATTPSPAAVLTGLAPASSHGFTVEAVDATGNAARGPSVTAATTGAPDEAAPTVPADGLALVPGSTGTSWARVTWRPASDAYGIGGYTVSVDGEAVGTAGAGASLYTVGGLEPGTTYRVTLSAVDTSGNTTAYGTTVTVTTGPAYDKAVPRWSRHAKLSVRWVSATSVRLSWPAATDDTGVLGYRVYVDGRPVVVGDAAFTPVNGEATTAGTSWTVTGLERGKRHEFAVQAGDVVGKWTGVGLRR